MAVISLGGKQYLVKPGEVIKTFNLNKAEGDLVVTKDLLTQKDVELKVLGNKLSKKTKVLKQRIESMAMTEFIFNVMVPTEKQIEIKNGKRQTVEKKIFPGYVMVEMIVTDESWYVVRNTPNVTGFVGFGVRPTPMSEEEVARIKKRMSIQEPKHRIEFQPDDLVRINDGPLKGFEGKVTEIDEEKGKIKVSVNMFGRETPANIDFLQAKKI